MGVGVPPQENPGSTTSDNFKKFSLLTDFWVFLSYFPITEEGPCSTGKHDCDENAVCRDIGDDYICKCKENYYGNGTRGNCKGTWLFLV